MEITIRPATHADIATITALINRSVRELGAAYYSPAVIERSLIYVFGVDTQLIEDQTYYLATVDQQLAGVGGWSKRATLFGGDQMKAENSDPTIDAKQQPARIRAFFIEPQWARRGIGSKLLQLSETAAYQQGFRAAELVATLPGEPLYRAYGYTPIEPMAVDLGDGYTLATILMGKVLTEPR